MMIKVLCASITTFTVVTFLMGVRSTQIAINYVFVTLGLGEIRMSYEGIDRIKYCYSYIRENQ